MTTTKTVNFRNASHLDIAELLRTSTAWKSNGSMKAQPELWGAMHYGRLPREYHASADGADYVVYSYETPIAWRTQGQWHTPAESYSPTTTRQQSKLFAAVDSLLK